LSTSSRTPSLVSSLSPLLEYWVEYQVSGNNVVYYWRNKVRTKEKTNIWMSVWWKTKN
jgi:hypothetical protein